MYWPSADGYILLIDNTAHEGTTLLLPRPSLPNLHRTKLFIGSFPETLHGEIKIICRDVTLNLDGNFKDVLVKADIVECLNLVIQVTLLQQTFSISFGFGLHTLHLHHSGEVSQGLGGEGGGAAFFSSKLPLPIAKTFLRRYGMSSLWRGARNSCVKKNYKTSIYFIALCCQHLCLNTFTPHFF